MSSEPLAISIKGISKTYTIATADERPTLFTEALVNKARHPLRRSAKEDFQALTDVSFDVRKGEAVGVIGRNGAGKSTLLKILSRIVEATSGRIELYGHVGSLLEVGTGFHNELTGRENIFLNGSILGMSRRDIRRAFDSIVAFAEVDRFLDTPVKRYSSGMYVRLAFAVAAHLNPDILLVDEVLAVGDAQFQKKCLTKMNDVSSQEGRTILFVSHNMAAIEAFCRRCVYLEAGRVIYDGDTPGAIEQYLAGGSVGSQRTTGVFDLDTAQGTAPGSHQILRRIEIRRGDELADALRMGEGLSLTIKVSGFSLTRHVITVAIVTSADLRIATINTVQRPFDLSGGEEMPDQVILRVPSLPLLPGRYWIQVSVLERRRMKAWTVLDRIERAASFEVCAADVYGSGHAMSGQRAGIIFLDSNWEAHSDGKVLSTTKPAGTA
jgi:lipopolysaccharide transport system ATP-binding protein